MNGLILGTRSIISLRNLRVLGDNKYVDSTNAFVKRFGEESLGLSKFLTGITNSKSLIQVDIRILIDFLLSANFTPTDVALLRQQLHTWRGLLNFIFFFYHTVHPSYSLNTDPDACRTASLLELGSGLTESDIYIIVLVFILGSRRLRENDR